MFRILTLALVFLCVTQLTAQDKKVLEISRTNTPPKIDGVLDDAVWQNANEAKGFTQFKPEVGTAENDYQKTIVKATYDNEAIYFSAYLYDKPEEIMKQFNSRDNFGQQDFFGIIINPNNDAQNDTEFFLFPSGNQADAIASPSIGEDFGWNAVWVSAVKIVEDGWIIEAKIPYSTLRFSNQDVQTWGLQFHRHFRSKRSQYTWNPLDPTKGNIGLYHGELRGIKNIEPPTRLSFYPFASAIVETQNGVTEDSYNIGLDIKYGISENFTLDATLIPDFSQAGFDDVQLNLGPFEQQFAEQRQFFTEGVDLFTKGNLFYSRRIGSAPTGSVSKNDNEVVDEFPKTVSMLNAIKISGRTKKGLGIGIFNAITEKTSATVRDTLTGLVRKEVVEPLSNYNILVVDQQFNKNSSVSLINTNVTRNGHFRDANVTGLLLNLNNKSNTYGIDASGKMSSLNLVTGTLTGYSTQFSIGKIGGNYRYSVGHNFADENYDINDMGIIFQNNYSNFSANASYRIFEPTKLFNNMYVGIYGNYNMRYKPNVYAGKNVGVEFNATTKKLHGFGANINLQPGKQLDFFGPRVDGRYFISEDWLSTSAWISSNYNSTFAIDANIGYETLFEPGRDYTSYWYGLSPRIKFNEKFLVVYSFDYDLEEKERGYIHNSYGGAVPDDVILYGQRDQTTIENSLSGSYNFNSYHGLTLTFRNYWSTVTYENDLYELQNNGRLTQESGYTKTDTSNPDVNFNTWNLDFGYSWQFAPGSQLTALYRNQLFNNSSESSKDYFNSLEDLFNQNIKHTFSLKVVYFIDYNNVKNIFSKNNS
ncbi:hypothetical protein GCM10022271_23930 [Corallibacter vietnamensis]|uniref:Protein with DOMON-like ligand-binding domain protein n=1 Tax=Corallibacter vietnamensis TaxID=904130 RepID=A0ABP7HF49_9FLAO